MSILINGTYVPPWGSNPLDECVGCRTGNTDPLQIYKDENVTQSNGIANLTVKDDPSTWLGVNTEYSSGYLHSKEKFKYGKIEMTCKLPQALGLYPAFWMFSGSGNGTGDSDEIDIFEFCTESPNTILSNIHGCYGDNNEPINTCNDQWAHNIGFDFTANWFTMGVNWTPYKVEWYIDILDGNEPLIVRTFPKYYTLQMDKVLSCSFPGGFYYKNPTFPEMPLHIRANLRVKKCGANNYPVAVNSLPQSFQIKEITVQQSKPCDLTTQFDNLELFEDTEWTNEDQYFSNLTLGNDVTLTINNSKVEFASIGQLKMRNGSKLILNGSTLTSCAPGLQWEGINTSQNLKTEIEMTFGSVIENAIIGVHLQDITWGGDKDLMSTLTMNKSTIRNCDVGVKLDFGITTSYISNNSSIEDCGIGIKLYRSIGLIIDNTTFTNNHEGIRSIDSYLQVRDGNKFIDGDIGISLEGTFPVTTGIDIGNADLGFNTFENIDEGIVSSGAESPAGANITNCKFLTGDETAIAFVGANDYLVSNNDFEGYETGVLPEWTGANLNKVQCNNFNDLCVGTIYWDENIGSEFLENNFTTNHADVIVYYATLRGVVGRLNEAAANCFSSDVYDLATDGNESFDYHYYDDSADEACQEPIYDGNYNPIGAAVEFGNCDGNIGIFNLIGTGGDVTLHDVLTNPNQLCTTCVKDSINKWITNVVSVGEDNPLTDADEETNPHDPVLPDYEEIMTEWINFGIFIAIKTNNEGLGNDIMIPLKKWKWQKRLFGFKLLMGNVSEAEAILNDLETSTQNQINFKAIQQINIKRFKAFDSNNLITVSEINQLANLAIQKFPSSGYARSLYRLLSGVRLPVEVPDYDTIFEGKIRSAKKNEEAAINIYPNPFTDILTIDLNGSDVNEVMVLSLDQKVMFKISVTDPIIHFNLSDLNPGLYILKTENASGESTSEKIIKI